MVYDGLNDKSMLIGELFGTPEHTVVKSISSSGNSMFIDFKKIHYDALELEFAASIKYNKINSDCQSWLESNVLMSPNQNINCSWLITRQIGSYITLIFSYMEVLV